MATLISKATGNLTSGTNFATCDTATGALNLIRFNQTTQLGAATSVTSATFTVTNGAVIDGILLYVKTDGSAVTGTLKVDLQRAGASQASVTVNKADLPGNPTATAAAINAPTFFKFTSTATGNGASTYTIVLTTTGTGTIYYGITASGATNITRALRTTTAANPAAGDNIYVVGELTGAGTHNSFTITMDSTAATAYGGGTVNSTTVAGGNISVSMYGTLTYGTSSSTNYILRVAGDLFVYANGTLNIGTSGTPIPRDSTAVLEFQPVSADGDFGLRCQDLSTCNIYGLSRTSGKDIVKCKLTSDLSTSCPIVGSFTNGLASISSTDGPEATGTSMLAGSIQENTSNTTHNVNFTTSSTPGNTTQTAAFWLARGTGASNNRFVRAIMGNATNPASVTNGFYVDIDLQAGTIGTVTVIGNGTATSASITAFGTGYLIKMTGRVSSATSTPTLNLCACAVSGTITYTGASNFNFIYDRVIIQTAASIGDTTLSVDTDTGWLSGDVVALSPTSRTGTDAGLYTLNANAGASSLVSSLPIVSATIYCTLNLAYSGTSPTQAEIALLTRNVKVRSTSTTLMAYVYATASATFAASWVEFYRLGISSSSKRGLEFEPANSGQTLNAKTVSYCSLHDFEIGGFYISTGAGTDGCNTTISYCTGWNVQTFLNTAVALTQTDWSVDNCLCIRAASVAFTLSDIGGTLTNSTIAGTVSGIGFSLAESGAALGTFSGNTAHSTSSSLLSLGAAQMSGTIANFTGWRGATSGSITFISGSVDLTFTGLTLFGAPTSLVELAADTIFRANDSTIVSESGTYTTTIGIRQASAAITGLVLNNVDFSGSGTGQQPFSTADIQLSHASGTYVTGQLNSCKFGTTPVVKSGWTQGSYLNFQQYGQTDGDHRTEMRYGTLKTDTAVYHSASPSMRMTPSSASAKLKSAPDGRGILAAVTNGGQTQISVWVRKSAAGDGAAYNGAQPRLIQRTNYPLGLTTDTVLATAAAATGTWEQLSATCGAAGDDGAWEFVVDCDGTAGWVNVDDWAAV